MTTLLDVCREAGRMDVFECLAQQNVSPEQAAERFAFVPAMEEKLSEVHSPEGVKRYVDHYLVSGPIGIVDVLLDQRGELRQQ